MRSRAGRRTAPPPAAPARRSVRAPNPAAFPSPALLSPRGQTGLFPLPSQATLPSLLSSQKLFLSGASSYLNGIAIKALPTPHHPPSPLRIIRPCAWLPDLG